MKAVIWTAYGPPEVLKLREIANPIPKDNQILVRVVVSNVFPGDCELRRFEVKMPWALIVRPLCGLFKPRADSVLGQEYAGVVEEVGSAVTRFKKGDRVFGAVEALVSGSYAEYLVTYARAVTTIPDNLSFEEAAVITTGGLNALVNMSAVQMSEGGPRKKVLFNGAAGSIGTMAVQIARLYGADVTAVDSTHKLSKLLEIGAHRVIDYTKEDFTESDEQYDVVFDVVGKASFFRALNSVKPGGYFILINPSFIHLLLRLCWGIFSKRRIRFVLAGYNLDRLEYLKQLVASGRIKAVIDRRYTLEQAVEAHRYVETNNRIGNVILEVSAASSAA